MKKVFLMATVAATLALAACDKGGDDGGRPKDFVVNGVTWARSNLDGSGGFAAHPEDYGGYFDFETAYNACPAGWRIPTQAEWAVLFSLESHSDTMNGIKGRYFVAGGRDIFMPMGGGVSYDELHDAGKEGYYWTGTTCVGSQPNAYVAFIFDVPHIEDGYLYDNGFSVRCVKK